MLYNINLKEDENYFFICGLIRSFENRLLKDSDFLDLIDLPLKNLFNILIEKGYRLHGEYEKITYDMIFDWEMWHLKKLILENCTEDVYKLLFLKYDLPHIKKFLKAKYILKSENFDNLTNGFSGVYDLKFLIDTLAQGNYDLLNFTELSSFLRDFNNLSLDLLSGEFIDRSLDIFYFNYVRNIAKNLKNKILEDLIENKLLFLNLKNLIRLKLEGKDSFSFEEFYIPQESYDISFFKELFDLDLNNISVKFSFNPFSTEIANCLTELQKTNDLGLIEKLFDDTYVEYLRETTKYITSDLSLIYAYFYAKELELTNIKIIFVSKINNIIPDKVKKILRKSYV
ncbi:MAG: V-type ATPase subunit [Spirochaetes bacterium]|nr:V-type ATPase subunit [Spirochaetota bacterium]